MNLATKLRYQGYISTPPLWQGTTVSPFAQIELDSDSDNNDDSVVFTNQRLGKLVEEFVFHQLKQQPAVTWICDNLQIQEGKRTVGEIDALYYNEENPIHLEIAYKFYLYDTLENHDNPLAHWIGPNRKDNLFYKLVKLHRKQFPLLYSELAKPYLKNYHLDIKDIRQQLCFKGQLFLPYQNRRRIDIGPLNSDCVAGFYLSYHELERFKKFEFFIPAKLDWLIAPHPDVNWTSYSSAVRAIKISIENERSPMVWVKHNTHEISKCFVVYW